jgi:uncharacterized membrane protein YfcA
MTDILIAAGIFALAGVVQSLAGFGFGMVSMAILPVVLPVRAAVPVVALLGLIACVSVLHASRHALERRRVLPLLAGAFLGVPMGVWFLGESEPAFLNLALGIVLIGYSGYGLLRGDVGVDADESQGPWRDAVGAGAATLGGFLGGAFNVGGPPVVMYVAWRRFDPVATRATLQCFFLVATCFQLTLFGMTGMLTRASLVTAGLGVPALGLGLLVGTRLARGISRESFGRLVLVLLLALGVRLVVA